MDKRSREEKIRISELAVVSLWSLWTGRKLGPVAMWLSNRKGPWKLEKRKKCAFSLGFGVHLALVYTMVS